MTADRQAFSATRKRRYTTADIPGFGTIRIQSLTAGELAWIQAIDDDGVVNARLFVKSIVDDEGLRLFADLEVNEFNELDYAVAGPIITAITGHVKTLGTDPKNSPATSGDDSPSN